jgi:hypothetical protein
MDCIDGNELPLTHDFLAIMLGVRRAGVTVAVRDAAQRSHRRQAGRYHHP